MKIIKEKIFYSPTDLNNFVACKYHIKNDLTAKDKGLKKKEKSADLKLRIEYGKKHEQEYFKILCKKHKKHITIDPNQPTGKKYEDTVKAIKNGYDLKGMVIKLVDAKGNHYANMELYWSDVSLTNAARSLSGIWQRVDSNGNPIKSEFIGRAKQIEEHCGVYLRRDGIDVGKIVKGQMDGIIKPGSNAVDITDSQEAVDAVVYNFEHLEGSLSGYDLDNLFQIIEGQAKIFKTINDPTGPGMASMEGYDEAKTFNNIYEKTNEVLNNFKASQTFKNMNAEDQQRIIQLFKAKQYQEFKDLMPKEVGEMAGPQDQDFLDSQSIGDASKVDGFSEGDLSDLADGTRSLGMKLDATTTPKATTGQNFYQGIQEIPWKKILLNPKLLVLLGSKILEYGQKKYEPREIHNMFYGVFDPVRIIMIHIYCALRNETVESVMSRNIDIDAEAESAGLSDDDQQADEASDESLRDHYERGNFHKLKISDFLFEGTVTKKVHKKNNIEIEHQKLQSQFKNMFK